MDRIVGVGAERSGHTKPLEAVGSPDDGGHRAAVQRFRQGVPSHVRLNE